jgi:glucan phosphoethanolaminetransferase (alkaline phosphatase superfamily)
MKKKNVLKLLLTLLISGALIIFYLIGIEPERALALIFFWAIVASLLFLLTLAAIELRLHGIIAAILTISGIILVSASFGNMIFHYHDLLEFWKYNLNISGFIAGIIIIGDAAFISRLNRESNCFKRRNNLLDESLEEQR